MKALSSADEATMHDFCIALSFVAMVLSPTLVALHISRHFGPEK